MVHGIALYITDFEFTYHLTLGYTTYLISLVKLSFMVSASS